MNGIYISVTVPNERIKKTCFHTPKRVYTQAAVNKCLNLVHQKHNLSLFMKFNEICHKLHFVKKHTSGTFFEFGHENMYAPFLAVPLIQ